MHSDCGADAEESPLTKEAGPGVPYYWFCNLSCEFTGKLKMVGAICIKGMTRFLQYLHMKLIEHFARNFVGSTKFSLLG